MNWLTMLLSMPFAILAALTMAESLPASDASSIFSVGAPADAALTADPESAFWKNVRGVLSNQDKMGNPVTPKQVMEIRSRWTRGNLYLLFVCGFDSLYLKPDPNTAEETNRLWNWDVAEAFIGDDFENINLYKEFEVSPQGEWVDLDIDRSKPGGSPDAWRWNSGFKVKARIDHTKKIWYAEMCIPFQSISRKPALPGLKLRINFFRAHGTEPDRLLQAWRPTHSPTFHVPEAFGMVELAPVVAQ